jgi:hypothetical protein
VKFPIIPPLTTPDGRRAWAFTAIMGGCVVMTLFAAVGVYLVRGDAQLSFYLALAAHSQILIGMTALAAQFVKRTIKAGRDGIEISDDTIQSGDTVTMEKQQ